MSFTTKQPPSFLTRLKRRILFYAFIVFFGWLVYHLSWGQYLYTITAYCDCPICINVIAHQDSHFASGKPVYWGGVAADPSVRFGSRVDLVPHSPLDWFAVMGVLKGRRNFVVEDRGGKIKGRDIDLFIPDEMGGHKMALNWGVRKMRIKINGKMAT
jgi:3D (Asp-Asp-Asp) domain-containing protein